MAFALKRIFQLDSLTTPKTQLAGAYTVWDIPLGPVAGGYKTMRGTPEQLAEYLADQGLLTALTAQAILAQIDVAASAAAGVHVAVVNNLLVFSLSGTTPPATPIITPGTTVPTPVITVFTTSGH